MTARGGRRAVGPADRSALGIWLASRGALLLLTLAGAWQLQGTTAAGVPGLLARWDRWDVGLFRKVAEHGYAGYPERYPDQGIEAFFPGLPLVLALVHRLVPDWTAAGLLVSLVAGAVASVWLARLAALDGLSGERAVLYLVLSPYAVFLFAGYSEALFLAPALWGWLLARQQRWVGASLLVAAASTVRISGLFLACALVVQYLVTSRGRLRPDAAALLAPLVAVGAYFTYLRALTGDFWRWSAAQEQGLREIRFVGDPDERERIIQRLIHPRDEPAQQRQVLHCRGCRCADGAVVAPMADDAATSWHTGSL